ncbi:hypothetical protein [Anaerocolumna xylanovorans]|nr:hypothetical protein [Anaerocolumna xylanovorans]
MKTILEDYSKHRKRAAKRYGLTFTTNLRQIYDHLYRVVENNELATQIEHARNKEIETYEET